MVNIEDYRKAASICYAAERQLNRIRGRLDQLPWEQLTEADKDSFASKAEVVHHNVFSAEQLSTEKKVWGAILRIVLPEHKQD